MLPLAALLTSCEPTADRPAQEDAPRQLAIAVNTGYVGSGLLYLARARGYFAEEGVDLRIIPTTSGRDALRAVLDGRALEEIARTMGLDAQQFSASMDRMRFVLQLRQGLLFMLEEQARWAQRNDMLPRGQVPDFLDNIHLDALLAVDPDSVTVVR